MIVVIGSPVRGAGDAAPQSPALGLAAGTAAAAASAGATVQLVGKLGDDPAGDDVLLALHERGVGHAAVLRDAAHPTPIATVIAPPDASAGTNEDAEGDPTAEPDATRRPATAEAALPAGLPLDAADVELALRYLTDFRVVVLADSLEPAVRRVAIEAAAFAGAHVVDLHGTDEVQDGPPDPQLTAFDTSGADPDRVGEMAGRYAAGLDAGRTPAAAFADATRTTLWERTAD